MKPRAFAATSLLACALFLVARPAQAKIVARTIEYKAGDTVCQGYVAYDDAQKGKRPGVLVAHQWLGLTDYEQRRARQLAQMGYVALALDVYGKGQDPADKGAAGKKTGVFKGDRALWRQRALAAFNTLKAMPTVNPNKIAAIGYCFGGGTVLELARSGAPVAGVVSFHGTLDSPTPADAKNIKGKVLILHGADDPAVPLTQVMEINTELKNAKVDYEIELYGHAVHAFTQPDAGNDPTQGVAYDAKADKRSWQAMKNFFAEIFAN
jgi:dienelactone hydrolase